MGAREILRRLALKPENFRRAFRINGYWKSRAVSPVEKASRHDMKSRPVHVPIIGENPAQTREPNFWKIRN